MSTHSYKKNSLISLASLFFQSGYSAFLGLIANFILTYMLGPHTFGVYIATLSTLSFLNYFSDIGLAASLVQKKEIDEKDIITTFTIQQIMIIVLLSAGFMLRGFIQWWYNLPPEGVELYVVLLISFFFSSLKTIPSILLERQIQFQKIVLVQGVENTLFYVVVSVAALYGLGIQSFTIALLVRSLAGLILMYILSPWMPKIGISMKSARHLLSFGLPFQTNTLLALVKDDLLIIYLGRVLGLDALGLIGWAKRWGEAPIRIIMDNVNKILFPVFSRYQDDQKKVSRMMEIALRYQTMILLPLYAGAVLLLDIVVDIIPKYGKWAPALPLFYLFCLSALLSSYSSPFINLFNATSKIRISFYLMIFFTVSTWLLTPFLSIRFGMIGYPLTLVILSLTCIYTYIISKKYITINISQQIIPPLVSSLFMSLFIILIRALTSDLSALTLSIIGGAVLYIALLRYIFHINLVSEVRTLIRHD